jgi:hypothetical protein
MTLVSHKPNDPQRDSDPQSSLVSRYLFGVAGAALFFGLVGATVVSLLEKPHTASLPGGRLPQMDTNSSLDVAAPAGVVTRGLRFTLLQSGHPAVAVSGKVLRAADLGALQDEPVRPGLYVARVFYRGKPVADVTVTAKAGVKQVIPLPAGKLAGVEYSAGLAADGAKAGSGIPFFRRAAQIDARAVPPRLQLAAYELLHGSPDRARVELREIRKIDPANKDAAAVERLLELRLSHRR